MTFKGDILILPGSLNTEEQGHTSERILELLASVALDHLEIEGDIYDIERKD